MSAISPHLRVSRPFPSGALLGEKSRAMLGRGAEEQPA